MRIYVFLINVYTTWHQDMWGYIQVYLCMY